MDINKFIEQFAEQFDDTNSSEIKADTNFQELDEWSSLIALSLIAMTKTEYSKTISGKEIRSCTTVKDFFNLIESK
jgi:acyl carrier protein